MSWYALGGALLGQIGAANFNQAQTASQMRFQERMSSTAYRRATYDMEQAGLNPMLAFDQGGASTPQGAASTMVDPVGPAISTAMQAARVDQELKNMQAQEENTHADTRQKNAATGLNTALALKADEDRATSIASAKSANLSLERESQQAALYKGKTGAVRTNAEWIRELVFGGGSAISPYRLQPQPQSRKR